MKHGRLWDIELWWPSDEHAALGLRPRATFSTSGSSYFNVTLTAVRHLYIAVQQPGSKTTPLFEKCGHVVRSICKTNFVQ